MRFNSWLFDSMFPNYYDYKTPMFSEYKEANGVMNLEVIAPGYDKEDFDLYEDGGNLLLNIKRGEDREPLVYSILGRFRSPRYDFSKAEAKYKAGILKITIPKVQENQKALARHIGIN